VWGSGVRWRERGEEEKGGGESRIFLKWYIERWVCIGPESSEWTEVKEEEEEEEEEGGGSCMEKNSSR